MMVNAPLLPFLFFLAARCGGEPFQKWDGPISTKRDKKILFSRHPFLLLTTRGRCSLPFSKKNETEGLNIYLLSNVNGSTPAEGQYRHNDISCLLPVYVTFLPSVFYFTPESLCVLKSGKAGGLGPTEQLEVGGGGCSGKCDAMLVTIAIPHCTSIYSSWPIGYVFWATPATVLSPIFYSVTAQ